MGKVLKQYTYLIQATKQLAIVPLIIAIMTGAGCSSGGGGGDEVVNDGLNSQITVQVEANALGSAAPTSLNLMSGESATISLTPTTGNQVVSVQGCEGTLANNQYQIDWSGEDCSVYVEFGPAGEQLSVEVFGDGRIESAVGVVCEARESCEEFLPANAPVRLTAVPAPGWSLNHWTGCDSVQDSVCVVNMDGPEGVYPAFAQNEPPRLNQDVIVLSDNQLDAIQEVDDASIVFRSSVDGLDTFEVGKILVSNRDNGFARRITRVIAISQTPVLVQTRNVPITDIIEEGTLVWQGDTTNGTDLEFIPEEGVTVVENNERSLDSSISVEAVVFDLDRNLATQEDQVTLAIRIASQFTPDFSFEKRFGRDASIRFVAGAKATVSASLGYKVSIPTVLPIKLGTFRSPPIPIGPIVLLPRYELFADVGGSIDTSLSVTTSFSLGGNLGVYKKSGESWKPLNTMSASAQPPTLDKIEVNVNAGIWAGVDAQFLVYGIAGPFIKAGPNSGYKRTFSLEGSDAGCFNESAFYGAQAITGGRIDLILWETTLPSRTLSIRPIEISWMNDQRDQCRAGVYGPPQNVQTSLDENNQVTANWEPPVGIPLVKYSVFRDNTLIGTVWDLEYIDETVSDNVEHCYHVVGFDSEGRSSVKSDPSCIRTGATIDNTAPSAPSGLTFLDSTTATLELTWNASVDDSNVVAYLVLDGNQVVERSVDTTVRITQLLPGGEYCFSVLAIDPAGNRSAQSEVQCGRTLAEDAGLWRMRIACSGRQYVLENQVDLQSTQQGIVNFAGEGVDYPGTPVAYIVSGTYSGDTAILDGRITYTFANDDRVRVDLFTVDLSTGDSGDVATNQIQVTGCDTIVRFDMLNSVVANRSDKGLRQQLLPAMALNDSRGIVD